MSKIHYPTPDLRKDFLTEAQTIAHLEHPHILRITDFGVYHDNDPFLITAYAPHGTLRQHHPKGSLLELTAIVNYIKQIAEGLQYAHDKKIIHSAVKPENMLLGYNKDILLDFSNTLLDKIWYEIWEDVGESPSRASWSDYWDNLPYIAPDEHPCPASDQYTLGVVVYEWLSGSCHFTRSDDSVNPQPLRERIPALSPAVEGVIFTALSKDPRHRFADVRSFANALEQASLPRGSAKAAGRVGQQVGKYRLIRLLGQGGFADVYLGEHIHLKIQAAIKVLHTRLTKEDLETLLTEAQTTGRLEHPHIVRAFDFDMDENGFPFLVMGYAPNGTLRQRHPKGVKIPPKTIVNYVKQVADALQHAHNEKVIHRDIKPENMLLGRYNEILLSDFGVAVVAHSTLSRRTEDVTGTVTYMAPEQLQGKPQRASDQYALGIVVYEWITGTRPFNGSHIEIATQHALTPPPPLSEKAPEISSSVELVVLTALAKDPRRRFASVQSFAIALEQAYQPKPRGTTLHTYRGGGSVQRTAYVTPPGIHSAVWSPNGTRIASAASNGTIQVWDAFTGQLLYTFRESAHNIAWSPDGTCIAVANDTTVRVLDAFDGTLLYIYRDHYDRLQKIKAIDNTKWWNVTAISWSPDSTHIASGDGDKTVQVWDAKTGRNILTYQGHSKGVQAVAWSPNGKYIASGGRDSDKTVQVWDAATGQNIYTYQEHSKAKQVQALAWSPNSEHIVSSCSTSEGDDAVHVWEAVTGKEICMYQGHSYEVQASGLPPYRKYIASDVQTVAWSPNGKYIASGGDYPDNTVQVWDATTGQHFYTYQGHSSGVRDVAWSPDSARIASWGGWGGQMVQIWQAL
jgi:serine/threonine protein kinase